jgi:hypothetical protein
VKTQLRIDQGVMTQLADAINDWSAVIQKIERRIWCKKCPGRFCNNGIPRTESCSVQRRINNVKRLWQKYNQLSSNSVNTIETFYQRFVGPVRFEMKKGRDERTMDVSGMSRLIEKKKRLDNIQKIKQKFLPDERTVFEIMSDIPIKPKNEWRDIPYEKLIRISPVSIARHDKFMDQWFQKASFNVTHLRHSPYGMRPLDNPYDDWPDDGTCEPK